jgi:hypothetical protein
MLFPLLTLLAAAGAVVAQQNDAKLDCSGLNGIKPACVSPESYYRRDVFWVGGHYVAEALGLMTYDQMYVEKLTGLGGAWQKFPIVLFHGGGVSGAVSSKWFNASCLSKNSD